MLEGVFAGRQQDENDPSPIPHTRITCGCRRRRPSKQVYDGKLILQDLILETRHSFLDYVTNGLEISLIVAVDFTRSNKDVFKKDS